MRLFHVIGNDDLYVNRLGSFYMLNDHNEVIKIEIPKNLTKIFAKYVLNTFIGPLNGEEFKQILNYNIDFRVVSEIKRGIKKPHVYYE